MRKPRNPLGWIILAVGGFLALSEDARMVQASLEPAHISIWIKPD